MAFLYLFQDFSRCGNFNISFTFHIPVSLKVSRLSQAYLFYEIFEFTSIFMTTYILDFMATCCNKMAGEENYRKSFRAIF